MSASPRVHASCKKSRSCRVVEELTLYEAVTDIAEDYFGPAARRFVDRLIINHLGKKPGKLTNKDLKDLITWIKLTVGVLTDDPGVVLEFTNRLNQLTRSGAAR